MTFERARPSLQASTTPRMSLRTSASSFPFSAPTLMTMSTSWAPSRIAFLASRSLICGSCAPSGNPTTQQTFTAEPWRSFFTCGTKTGFTQTEKKPCCRASAQSFSTSAAVASGLSSVWSMSFATFSGVIAGSAAREAPPFPSISFTFAAIRSTSSADSSDIPLSFSISRIIATRFRCLSAVHAVARKTSTIRLAASSSTCPAPSARRRASLCSRAFFASASVLHVAASTPGTLFAAIAEPIPAPSTTTPKSASPRATRSAAARAKTG